MNLWSFTDRFVQEQKILFNVFPGYACVVSVQPQSLQAGPS